MSMTPREIVHELNRHIIGQDDAKRAVAIALRNRWRRMQLPAELRAEVTPKNILMIGPTGVGKAEIARRLARLANAPFIKVEATKFTEVGYVGRDVESIIRDHSDAALKMLREQEIQKVKYRAEDAAEERILDALLPAARPAMGFGDEPAREDSNTRQLFRKRLREGQLDDKEIDIEVADNPAGPYKAADQPLVTRTMEGVTVGQAIDPSIFTDPNTGKSYILYGNGSPAIAELNDDMVSIKAGTVKKLNGLNGFRESVVVAYRDGKYHWTWSCDDANSPNYHVRYGVSDSIDGTITYKGVLLQKDSSKNLQGTAHQSDVHVTDADGNDRWLMAYHRHYTPLGVFTSGLGYHRETAIDEITFDADGLMQTIHPTDEGVSIEMADTTALDGAIEAADKLGTDGSAYTEASWKAFEDALAAAKTAKQTFLDSGLSQADVDAAAKALTDAQNALEESQPEPEHPAAGTILSIAVTAQPAKTEYKVGEALDVAGLVVTATVADGNGGSTTRELAADEYELLGFDSSKASDKVTVTVQSVADSTKTATFTVKVVADETPTPDPDLATEEELKQLEDAIAKAEAEKLNQDDYTADSWKAYANALAQAKKVLAKENATSTEVQDAIRHLTEARKALVKVSADGKKPGAVISDTGVAVFGVAGAVVVLAAAGIALTIWRKRRI